VELVQVQQLVGELAAQNHGTVGARELTTAGVTRQQIGHLVDRGSLTRLGPQTYRPAGVPPNWRSDLAGGLHALGPGTVVSHRAAAKLLGLDRFGREPLEFTVRRRRRGAFFLEAVIHTSLTMPDSDTIEVAGLPTTTATRTIIDLAALRINDERLEAAVDSSLRLGLADLEGIMERLGELRGKGRRGVRRLDRVLLTSGGHSFLERAFLKLLDQFALPRPSTQIEHREGGVHHARVDFEYVDLGLVVEVSGGRGHSSAADRAKDARRRNELQHRGKVVLEFTYEDVVQRRPYVVSTLREALRSCRAQSRIRD